MISVRQNERRNMRWLGAMLALAALSSQRFHSCQDALAAEAPWKLISSHDQSGAAVPALMQVADLDRSDSDIAGLMFRCSHKGIETVVIVLDPMPPRSTGTIALAVDGKVQSFEASTIPTGAGLLIPFDPSDALATTWRNQRDLLVQVTAAGKAANAVLDITNLAPALKSLGESCYTQDVDKP